jgi:hypothetical protein
MLRNQVLSLLQFLYLLKIECKVNNVNHTFNTIILTSLQALDILRHARDLTTLPTRIRVESPAVLE